MPFTLPRPVQSPRIGALRIILVSLAFMLSALQARAFDTEARAAYVVDLTTDTVLMSKNADEEMPPASMSKLMTLYIAFEALKDGRLKMDERLPVSQHAMNYGGSTMFLDTTDHPTVKELLQGIVVLSGNDACAVIAEALSPDGTEAGFAKYMTQRAHAMGLTHAHFANSNGWPDPGQRMSAHDLAVLAEHIIKDFPQYYPLFSEKEFDFDGRAPQNIYNRNPLLSMDIGADGLKTGHTQEAGYGLVGSAKQGNRRVLFVVFGLPSEKARAEQSRAIVNWAFRNFREEKLATAGQVLTKAPVFLGASKTVGLTVAQDVTTLVPVLSTNDDGTTTAQAVFDGPVKAPIRAGQKIGELVIQRDGLPEKSVPLVAASDVKKGGFLPKVQAAAGYLVRRLNNGPATETPADTDTGSTSEDAS